MENHERIARYLAQRGKSLEGFVIEQDGTPYNPDLTGPQRRRVKHKPGHRHTAGERCVKCRPYKAGTATLLTAEGPRDWRPGSPPAKLAGRKNGKNTTVLSPGSRQPSADEVLAARSRMPHRAHKSLFRRRPGGN